MLATSEPANSLANAANEAEQAALLELAKELADELGVSKDAEGLANIVSKIRWYPNKAGAVVIVRRGADRKVLATISPTSGKWSHLYPSWERVLANLEAKKIANNANRASHDDLEMGSVPVLASEER